MKLLTYNYQGKESIGVLTADGKKVIPAGVVGLNYNTMNELITKASKDELSKLEKAASCTDEKGAISLEDTVKVSPIPHPLQDIICLGFNYLEHAEESVRLEKVGVQEPPTHAIYFSKRVDRAVPDGGEVPCHSDLEKKLDYEVELALIIGKDAKNVPADQAWDYIFGYTILNDISARTLQGLHKQFYFGKSLDGFNPLGPWIVTADEFDTPPNLAISCCVNGELRQNSNTKHLLFDIPHIISELSSGMTLKAGTIIATGTPSGVGGGMVPQQFLKPGDVVECKIEKVGTLRNTIV